MGAASLKEDACTPHRNQDDRSSTLGQVYFEGRPTFPHR